MKQHIKLFIITTALMTFNMFAQILNNDFEKWSNANPENWLTTNIDPFSYPVTKTTDYYSGSFALKGEIISSNFGELILPVITYAPDSIQSAELDRYSALNLNYKFLPVEGDQLVIAVFMYKAIHNEIQIIGAGFKQIFESTNYEFALGSVPIEYVEEGTPNICTIVIGAGHEDEEISGHIGTWFIVDNLSFSGVTDVKEDRNIPNGFVLEQNYPNPFNPSTTIRFNLPTTEVVSLKLFNSVGQEVATLIDNELLSSGSHSIDWNAGNLSSGVYLCRLTAGKFNQINKMTLIK